jgi:superfamily I DNA/RNA helicase
MANEISSNLLEDQKEKRRKYLEKILSSDSSRKLIVAGPGTGKTFTFGEVLKQHKGKQNLALTFIRKLVADMEKDFGDYAEVKTFHAYCKKLLHERNGRIELAPFLTKVIESDAVILGRNLDSFDEKFQTLAEGSPEVQFYLERGDYYEVVSFNDSVFRLYTAVRDGYFELETYNQVVVDEFQDFNPLEVAFISELEKKSPILIVGDDDQAVYHARNSSPDFLREKFYSGKYEVFQLPYCTRCPQVVVDATNAFIQNVIESGGFQSRVDRPFAPYLEGKEYENSTYPKIISATTTNIACLSKFVISEIGKIPEKDIQEAYEKNYPCVLIVGKRQYLNPLAKKLREIFKNVNFAEAQNPDYSILDAYELLLAQENSNLGWRILAEFEFSTDQLRKMISASLDGIPFVRYLPQEFVEKHDSVIHILRSEQLSEDDRIKLIELLGDEGDTVVKYFFPLEDESKQEVDTNQPTILLSSFEGCKGLSAGHVFVVGLNDGVMPKIQDNQIDDIECCRFLVALTRTRKRCYLISNKWDYSPNGQKAFQRSMFISLIPSEYLDEKGYLKSKDIV